MSGDPVLAAFMRANDAGPPVEKITRTDFMATAFNRDKLGSDPLNRIVDLECGHQVVTRNTKRAPCPRCHRMILEGYDYDAFRNLKTIRDPIEDDEECLSTSLTDQT